MTTPAVHHFDFSNLLFDSHKCSTTCINTAKSISRLLNCPHALQGRLLRAVLTYTSLAHLLSLCADTIASAGSACPTSWERVTCDNTTQRPIGIDLSGVPLNCDTAIGGCQFPPGIFSGTGLTALHSLNLARTSFTLDMDTMDFSGMLLLRYLDLRYMPNLVGPLNPLWGEWMPRMQEFYMAGAVNVVCDVCDHQ